MLLNVLVGAMKNRGAVQLNRMPRMADFAMLITAAEPALGWRPGSFMRVYAEDRAENSTNLIESDSVAVALQGLLTQSSPWKGTFTELLAALNPLVDLNTRQNKSWPQGAQSLSNRVRRAAPALRSIGVSVEFQREPHTRRRLVKFSMQSRPSVPGVPDGSCTGSMRPESPANQSLQVDELAGDTGDIGTDDLPEGHENRARVEIDEPPIWRCPRCGRGFSSRFASRLHTALCLGSAV
jgi:hypothetical protein